MELTLLSCRMCIRTRLRLCLELVGGTILAIILRYNCSCYGRSMWVIGVISLRGQCSCWLDSTLCLKPVIGA